MRFEKSDQNAIFRIDIDMIIGHYVVGQSNRVRSLKDISQLVHAGSTLPRYACRGSSRDRNRVEPWAHTSSHHNVVNSVCTLSCCASFNINKLINYLIK